MKTALLVVLAVGVTTSADAGWSIRKDGACPTGYSTSGKFCVPNKDAGTAVSVDHMEACPSGTSRSGRYCVTKPNR